MELPIELGPRSAEVMRFVWSQQSPVACGVICDEMQYRHDIAYTTVTNTLERLVRQGLLERVGHKNNGLYSPTCTAAEFVEQAVEQLIAQIGLNEHYTNTLVRHRAR